MKVKRRPVGRLFIMCKQIIRSRNIDPALTIFWNIGGDTIVLLFCNTFLRDFSSQTFGAFFVDYSN